MIRSSQSKSYAPSVGSMRAHEKMPSETRLTHAEERPVLGVAQPFVDPSVRPETNCFCRTM